MLTKEQYEKQLLGLSQLPDSELLMRLLFGEIRFVPSQDRGPTDLEVLAVALSVRNRVEKPRWWGKNWKEVILKPWQYSCFNFGDPNFEKLLRPYNHGQCQDMERLKWFAKGVAQGHWRDADITNGATHYITPAAFAEKTERHWSKKIPQVHQDEAHLFFKE